MLGSSIWQFGRSLYPVTWSLPFPISNPVLVPPEYAYRNVVIGTICNTQCSPNAIPIGQAFCGSFRTFQYCISFWLFFRKYYSLTWKVLQDIPWLGKSYKLFRHFFFFVGYHEILFELIFWNRIGAAENLGAHPENRSNLILDSILSRIISTYFIDIYTQIFYKPIPVSQIWHSPHLPPSLLIGYLVIPPQYGDSPRLRCNIWEALEGYLIPKL